MNIYDTVCVYRTSTMIIQPLNPYLGSDSWLATIILLLFSHDPSLETHFCSIDFFAEVKCEQKEVIYTGAVTGMLVI